MIDDETKRALYEADAEMMRANQDSLSSAWTNTPAQDDAARRRFEEAYARREKIYAAALAANQAEIEECDRIMRRLERGRCRHRQP